MYEKIKAYLWVLPFFFFLFGYQITRWLSPQPVFTIPSLIGMPIATAIKSLSSYQLNVRILKEKEDPDLPEGIVLAQTPAPNQKIKPHQSVYLVLSCRPPNIRAFSCCGLTLKEIEAKAHHERIKLKIYYLEALYPKETCIAQFPSPGKDLTNNELIVYISKGTSPLRLFPDLKGKTVEEVRSALERYGITIQLYHNDIVQEHVCTSCRIFDQRPLPGSVIDNSKPCTIQLVVTQG